MPGTKTRLMPWLLPRSLACLVALSTGCSLQQPSVKPASAEADPAGTESTPAEAAATPEPEGGTAVGLPLPVPAGDMTLRPRPGVDDGKSRYGIAPPDTHGVDLAPIPLPAPNAPSDFLPVPDRWRLAKDLSLVKETWYDPYNRNLLKADRPFYRDWFFNFSFISDTVVEARLVPTRVSQQVNDSSLDGNNAVDTFGHRQQLLFNQNFITSFVFFQGDTVFRPPDYELRITPVFNINHASTEELGVLRVDPRRGTSRDDGHVGMQELFLDKHLRNVSDRYDFDSLRIGIQPFNTDFRGFLFQDNQLGVRLFGNRDNNIYQYNLAWFRRLEKDTNSGLNSLQDGVRNDDVFIANLYRQDFPVRGYTSQGTVVYNRNREAGDPLFFDANGFLARPAALGLERNRDYDVVYLGYNGDGHFGRINLTSSFYYAIGSESQGTFVAKPTDIRAWFAAAEASMDFDWIRLRLSALHGSGDDNPYDETAEGFDAIFENPQIAGSDTSFWIRQGIANIGGGGVTLQGRDAVQNSLRSSKELGQSNFTNPGVQLYGIGADFDVLPQLRVSANFNKLFFSETAPLKAARNQGRIDNDIGWDLSAAIIYRPFATQNIVGRLSGAVLVPGQGFEDLFGIDRISYSVLANIVFTY